MSGNNNQRKRPAQQGSSGTERNRAEESRERVQRLPAEDATEANEVSEDVTEASVDLDEVDETFDRPRRKIVARRSNSPIWSLEEYNERAIARRRKECGEHDEVVLPRNRRLTALNRVKTGILQIQRRIEEELEHFEEARKSILHQNTVINCHAYNSILNQINELLLQARQKVVEENEEIVPRQEPGPSNQ